ncbi:hypothetical protein DFJ43DRAFT_1175587 [Lentinula guzmanii]|uniref:Uncharacterized protein n=1 Tax=Lentinula guzmanii TaxID=2804957 RepID=A0AA38JBM6_9AGAR|nr:hypothetical protein DFJ43DRAFT_1175587 [Lentinula guzmanii]
MAKRIEIDPSKIPCPDFASAAYGFIRKALVADPDTPDVNTDEEAAQKLRSQWETENNALKTQFQTQIQADEQLAEDNRRLAQEDKEQAEQEQRQRELEVAKEREKKRTPLYDFNSGVGITSIPQHLHPYAEKKISQRKFVELWYFTPEASQEAKEHRSTVDTNRLELAADNVEQKGATAFTLLSTHSTRPSNNVVPDAKLAWSQIQLAKTPFIECLRPTGNYPNKYIAMFASFYTNMEMHNELRKPEGARVMALYHAEMRRAWYLAADHGEPFDLSVFSETVLQECRNEMWTQAHRKATEGMFPRNSLKVR